VVNIDNGFGGAFAAAQINALAGTANPAPAPAPTARRRRPQATRKT